jgi:hypothetical protein
LHFYSTQEKERKVKGIWPKKVEGQSLQFSANAAKTS